jgi:hypothetical protein
MGLRKLMDLSMAQIEKDIRSNPLSIEELQRWRDVIEARFENQMCNVNAFRMSCESRVMQMRQVSDLIPKGMLFLMEALKERFGGVNILSDEKIKSDPKLAGLVSDLHATLLNLMADKTAKKSEALQKIAHAEVKNPLEAQSMFLYDTEDNPALTNSFKDLARSLVKGASETKAYRNLFKQLDKKLGIKAK